MVGAMTAVRLIPLPIHGALEFATGLFLLVAPFLFGFGPPAAIVSVVVGVLVVGLALGAATAEPRSGLPIATHYAFDYGLAFGLLGAATLLAAAGDTVAGVVLLATALAQLALNLTTRYSLRG